MGGFVWPDRKRFVKHVWEICMEVYEKGHCDTGRAEPWNCGNNACYCSRVGGGALTRWPPSAAQTARAGLPHANRGAKSLGQQFLVALVRLRFVLQLRASGRGPGHVVTAHRRDEQDRSRPALSERQGDLQ